MNHSSGKPISLINPNWSAFVLLIVLLSAFNGLAQLLLPLSAPALTLLRVINVAISAILWADFVYLLRKSPDRRYFLTKQYGWMVLLGSIPFFRFLRIIWFRLILRADGRQLREFMSRIAVKKNAEGTLLFVLFIAICVFEVSVAAVLTFEATAPGGNIRTISDALWWASVTVATVGYGDKYPVTLGGRAIGILLMAVGIALFSVITGTLAEWFTSRREQPFALDEAAAEMSTPELIAQIRQLLIKQESEHEQTMAEIKARLVDLESKV
jgi:voltage-gated potassium channel